MTPVILLPTTSTEEKIDYTGEPVPGSAWYGKPSGLHTISIYLQNFTGKVYFQGTLSEDPNAPDAIWFYIDPGTGKKFIEFPRNQKQSTSVYGGDNGVYGFTFKANVMWIRAKVERSYFLKQLNLTYDQTGLQGAIRKIMMSI